MTNYYIKKKPELLKNCLELIGYQKHKAKSAEIAKIRKMKPHELRKKIIELEKEAKLIEENKCDMCLKEQFMQQKIDEKTYDQRLLANMVRELTCQYCDHETLICDDESLFCQSCGSLQSPLVSHDKYPH